MAWYIQSAAARASCIHVCLAVVVVLSGTSFFISIRRTNPSCPHLCVYIPRFTYKRIRVAFYGDTIWLWEVSDTILTISSSIICTLFISLSSFPNVLLWNSTVLLTKVSNISVFSQSSRLTQNTSNSSLISLVTPAFWRVQACFAGILFVGYVVF